jgi:hypothetical protein
MRSASSMLLKSMSLFIFYAKSRVITWILVGSRPMMFANKASLHYALDSMRQAYRLAPVT